MTIHSLFFVLRTIWKINFELSHTAKSHAWEGYSIRDMQKKVYALHNGLFGPPLRFSWRWYTLNSDYHLIEFCKSGLLNRVCWIKVSKERHLLWTHWFELLFPNTPRPITAKIDHLHVMKWLKSLGWTRLPSSSSCCKRPQQPLCHQELCRLLQWFLGFPQILTIIKEEKYKLCHPFSTNCHAFFFSRNTREKVPNLH